MRGGEGERGRGGEGKREGAKNDNTAVSVVKIGETGPGTHAENYDWLNANPTSRGEGAVGDSPSE